MSLILLWVVFLTASEHGTEQFPAQGVLVVDVVLVDGPVGNGVHLHVLRGRDGREGRQGTTRALLSERRLPTRPGGPVADIRGQGAVTGEVRHQAIRPAVVAVGDGCDFGTGVRCVGCAEGVGCDEGVR